MNKQSVLAAASLLGGFTEVLDLDPLKVYKPVDERKQASWFHKTMMRPQKSRHKRTKN